MRIPQADEQQRLLANLITQMNLDRTPLPRFWYLPRGEKAAVVLTGDDHGHAGTIGQFNRYQQASPAGCSVADWQCVRSTSYVYPGTDITDAQAQAFQAAGFEIALHLSTDCADFTPASLEDDWETQLPEFGDDYPSLAAPRTSRTHCIAWSDWASEPKVELSHGVRFDANYYYWPGAWVQDRPGMFTGSGFPMRFADADGSLIDVYQAATQLTDESEHRHRPPHPGRCSTAPWAPTATTASSRPTCTPTTTTTRAPTPSSPRPRRAACRWSPPSRCSTGSTAATTRPSGT